jgi:hypothetical protein
LFAREVFDRAAMTNEACASSRRIVNNAAIATANGRESPAMPAADRLASLSKLLHVAGLVGGESADR